MTSVTDICDMIWNDMVFCHAHLQGCTNSLALPLTKTGLLQQSQAEAELQRHVCPHPAVFTAHPGGRCAHMPWERTPPEVHSSALLCDSCTALVCSSTLTQVYYKPSCPPLITLLPGSVQIAHVWVAARRLPVLLLATAGRSGCPAAVSWHHELHPAPHCSPDA